jgi:hypothetical protein
MIGADKDCHPLITFEVRTAKSIFGKLSGTKSHSAIVLVADFVHGDEGMGNLKCPLALLVCLSVRLQNTYLYNR